MDSVHRRQVLAALIASAAPLAARAEGAKPSYPTLQALLERYVKDRKVSGGVVAIRRGKAAPDFVSVGTLAFDSATPMTPDSLFRVYSMTKPTVGVAAMMLIERGQMRLDQPLSDILPAFKDMQVIVGGDVTKTRPAKGPILIRHLLSHSSGLSYSLLGDKPLAKLYRQQGLNPGGRQTAAGPGELPPARDLETFGQRLAPLPLDFDPGTKWQYSVAADLMGLVIQRVSGKPFWDFMHGELFAPLGMNDTDFMVPADKLDRFTTVYFKGPMGAVPIDTNRDSPFARDRDLPSGGGGLVSSARDYIRFNAMLQGGGVLDGRMFLKPDTVRVARSNLLAPGVTSELGILREGFGAFMQVILPGGQFPGGEPPGSYGWTGAAGTTMWIDPVNDLSVVVMVQFMPATAYPLYLEARTGAYKDLRALGALNPA